MSESAFVKKPYKYYAIRILNKVIIRRTVGKLTRVSSTLYSHTTKFKLKQVTYTGGTVVGIIHYNQWIRSGYTGIKVNGYEKLTRVAYKAIKPFLV